MDKDRIAGSRRIKGEIKEALGKMVGDAKLKADGKADQAEDKARNPGGTDQEALAP